MFEPGQLGEETVSKGKGNGDPDENLDGDKQKEGLSKEALGGTQRRG